MQQSQKSIYNANAGVWGAKLDGRVDLEKYQYACRQADNFKLTPFGVLEKRPGTHYIANTKDDGLAVLWSFQFSTDVGYIIEVGDQYMRFFKDGAYIAASEIATPYVEADLRELQYRQINDVVYITHENYAPRKLIRETTTTFSIQEVTFDLPAFRDENASDITIAPSSTSGSVTLTATAPAWVSTTVYRVHDAVLEAGQIYRCLVSHTAGTFATDLAADYWEAYNVFTSDNVGGYFRLGQTRDANGVKQKLCARDGTTRIDISPSVTSFIKILGDWEFRTTGRWAGIIKIERNYTGVDDGTQKVIAQYESSDGDQNKDKAGYEPETAYLRLNFAQAVNTLPNKRGSEDAYAYLDAASAIVYGYAKVTAYTSATQVTATVIENFYDTSATDIWAEGAWSARRGYPKSSTIYEQRMIYAGNTAEPLRVWGTRIGDFQNFQYGVDDSDAFTYDIPSTEQNPIVWISGNKELVIGNGKEYGTLYSGSEDLPLSPTNAIYRPQQAIGYSSIKPELIGDVLVGVERNGRRLREIAYQFDRGRSGGYTAADLNRLNEDIAESGIIDIDFQQLREPYVYCVMAGGNMAVLHYNRADGIVGWSEWITQGTFESVAVIRGTDDDEVWVTVNRTINGSTVRFVERFNPVRWSDAEDAYYLDAGVSYDGASTTTITGLAHLNGEECRVYADGAVTPNGTPSGGQLTLATAASVVHVGLGFTPKWRPMRLDMDATYGNSQGHQKRIDEVYVRLYKSREVQYGVDNGGTTRTAKLRETTDVMNAPYPLATGEYALRLASTFGASFSLNDPDFFITQDAPCPLTLVATIFKYSISRS